MPQEKPELFNELSQYTKDMLRNSELLDRVSGKARGLAFTYYLAGNLKSAAVQFTQNFITGMPYLARDTKYATVKYMKAMSDTALGRHSKEEAKALHDAVIKGVTSAQYTQEISGHIASKYGNTYRRIAAVLAYPFMEMEVFNRKSAFIAMFRAQRAKGVSYDDAWSKAHEFVMDVHYLYGKANLPGWARGGTTAQIGLRTAYTFRAFNHNYLLSMKHAFEKNANGAGGWGVLGRSLAWLVLFGGLTSLPFLDDLLDFLERKTGVPFRANLRAALRGVGGKPLERIGMAGIPGLLGRDISGSLKMGLPTGDSNDLYGVWGGIGKKAVEGAGDFWTGQYWRGVESWSPTFAANPSKAYRGFTKGLTTHIGKWMFDEKGKPIRLTASEAIGQAVGFKPARLSDISQERRVKSNIKEYYMKKRADIRTRSRTE